ncbi:KAP family P-loop NTPase fold protein [Candidatus Oscillochloris fontis]|uniref:KAP family P-loop NTPase fold protein n=1 Tax=Candidatus Oscillochloris fontis TaxID=2496868 RepID=UPI00101CF257|nr:P-loop NTPase fold protein [Candidatus Oscillochloris fontis]
MHQIGYCDLPATEDELDFTPAVVALTTIVQEAQRDDTPLTVGVYGEWGSGKTSLMRMILDRLDPHRCMPVWFDAWRYAQQETLWRALLLRVVEALRERVLLPDDVWLQAIADHHQRIDPSQPPYDPESLTRRLDDLANSLYRSIDREEPGEIQFQWDAAGRLVAGAVVRAGFSYIPILGQMSAAVEKAAEKLGEEPYADTLRDLFQRERTRIYREQVQSLEQFHTGLTHLVKELVSDLDRRLVVFIDDLDRCLPEQAIGVLEALKVFLDIPGCVFVLGIDREIIERGIRVRYKEFALHGAAGSEPFPVAERDYLEKIIQVPFRIPPLAPSTITRFLQRRLPAVAGMSDEERTQVADLMTTGLLRNPRKVKRSFNIFRLHLTLDRAQGKQTHAGLIAKLTVIQSSFPDLYAKIARDPTLLRVYEAIPRGIPLSIPITDEQRTEMGKQDQRLHAMLSQSPWYKELTDAELKALVYQSKASA